MKKAIWIVLAIVFVIGSILYVFRSNNKVVVSYKASEKANMIVKDVNAADVKTRLAWAPNGAEVAAKINKIQDGNNTRVEISHPASFKPGKYTLKVDVPGRNLDQDFLWGVLAVNTTKSVYLPNETAQIHLSVLDDTGMMDCQAQIDLAITDPNGNVSHITTENGAITVRPECFQKKKLERPDFESAYKVKGSGKYSMKMTATTKNGTRTIDDFFEVKDSVPFDVERITVTRIYPPVVYPMTFKIKANQDFNGEIYDTVPQEFKIEAAADTISYDEIINKPGGKYKEIKWYINLKKGQEVDIGYIYQTPNVSPYFFILGPARFVENKKNVFSEERFWQLAIDVNDATWLNAGTAETWDTSLYVPFTGGSGTITSSTQAVATSTRSLAATVTSSASDQAYAASPNDVCSDAGCRIQFYARWTDTAPANTYDIWDVATDDGAALNFVVMLTTGSRLAIGDSTFAVQSTGTTPIVADTDYRIGITYTISGASTNTIELYLNGNLEATATNIDTGTGSSSWAVSVASVGTATVGYYAHLYSDNGSSGTPDPIYITAKRPIGDGTLNEYTTQIGSGGSGYGSGHAPQVNERPSSESNGWSLSTTTLATEEYTIESVSQGDEDITGHTIYDYMGWIIANRSNAATTNIVVNGVSTAKTMTTSFAPYAQMAGSTTYPSGGDAIGMSGSASPARTFRISEGGIVIAYNPDAPTPTPTPTDTPTPTPTDTPTPTPTPVSGNKVNINGGTNIKGGMNIP